MKTNVIGKKSVVICIVLLLVLSLNFTKIASSSPVKYEDDGVWFDSFDDASGIDPSKSSNYNLTEGRIKLAEGSNIHIMISKMKNMRHGRQIYHPYLVTNLSLCD